MQAMMSMPATSEHCIAFVPCFTPLAFHCKWQVPIRQLRLRYPTCTQFYECINSLATLHNGDNDKQEEELQLDYKF
jgi:hypothetical protein